MSNEPSIFQSTELKDFRKLNVVNWAIRIAIALGVGALVYTLLPYGVTMVENIFQITLGLTKTFLLGVPLFFAASFLWANKTLLRKVRERLSRKLWEWFIYNDPLDYIRGVVEDFKNHYQTILKAIQRLHQVAEELRSMADDLIREARGNMERAKAIMDEESNEQKANLYAYMSNRRMETTEDIISGYTEIEDSIEVMQEFSNSIALQIEAMEFDLQMMNLNLRVSTAKRDAAFAAQSVLENKSMEAARLEFAKNAYKQKVVEGVAQFKQFMERVKPILDADRIDQVIATKAGREMLDQFKKGVDIGGLKSFEEQLNAFKAKNEDLFKRTTSRERVRNQKPETIRTGNAGRFKNLN